MGVVVIEVLKLIALDAIFVGVIVLALAPLATFKRAAFAVLKRNFVGYFSNPTGYVFLCLFVLLTSLAAFWPHEFFTANLANLDQLNELLPFIMLIFIPAITMSIWSEERRLGTDELLLTLPADDFDIVMGKYLAAAAIFTASLLFSQLANYLVLVSLTLGDLDTGLFFSTYLGYWLIGLAMLAVGMVASFLTSNATVAFVLGVMFNAPLAFGASADVIIPSAAVARQVAFWGLAEHFDDLGRGVLSLSSIAYFLLMGAVGLYLCMVLLGSRNWSGGRDGQSMFGHYLVRTVALVTCLVAVCIFFKNHDRVRLDVSLGQVSSLSPKTREIIRNLSSEHPINIDAFVSAQVPEKYVQTKFNLISRLKEFDAMTGGKINVRLYDNLEPFSNDASLAEQRYGITPTTVRTRSRGAFKDEQVILGAAFSSGLEKVVVPFFDYGVPVEYELVRSIGTVAQGDRKSVGILRTDAQIFGGFSFAGGMPQQMPKQEIVSELEKQYDVEEVDPANPIDLDRYDVLIAVQPSSLGPPELNNLVEAVKAGQATAIFEDPMPIFLRTATGTGEPKQAPGGGMFGGGGGGGPVPKGDIQALWRVIGIVPPGEASFQGGFNPDLVWQDYNPYQKLQIRGIPNSWVFASNAAPEADDSINSNDPITSGLKEILFPVPGAVKPSPDSDLKFTALVKTSRNAGTIRYEQFRNNQEDPARLKAAQGMASGEQIVAARILGVEEDTDDAEESDATEDGDSQKAKPINVVYVADIDLMISAFLRIRARPEDDEEIDWHFENVNFLLNIVDELSGESQYVEIRKRTPHHSTLKVVERQAQIKRDEEFAARLRFEDKYNDEKKKAEEENEKTIKKFRDRVEELQKGQRDGDVNLMAVQQAAQDMAIQTDRLSQRLDVTTQQLARERDEGIEKIQRETDLEILRIQNSIKFLAVALPPIPPLLVGLVVFVRRRLREREGVSKSRLR